MKSYRKSVLAVLLIAAFSFILSSCSGGSVSKDSDRSVQIQTTDTSEAELFSSYTDETTDWSDWDMEEFNDPAAFTHFLHYTNNTMGYVSVYSSPVYNSKDDPEYFDTANMTSTDLLPENGRAVRKLINVGDKFGNLTCTEAYIKYTTSVIDQNRTFLSASDVRFEGEAEVTGYVYRAGENEGYTDPDELLFICTENSGALPHEAEIEVGYMLFDMGGVIFNSPSSYSLGTAADYDDPVIQNLQRGGITKVMVTLKDISVEYKAPEMGFHRNSAVISEIEAAD